MKDFIKKNITNLVLAASILILGIIAVIIAIRLYNLRRQAVAPTAPESKPSAQEQISTQACEEAVFELEQVSYSCNSNCESDSDCQSVNPDYICYQTSGEKRCRLAGNPQSETCTPAAQPTPSPSPTPTPTPTPISQPLGGSTPTPTPIKTSTPTPSASPTPTPTSSPTPLPDLPVSGTTIQSIIGIAIGAFILIGGIILSLF